MLAAAACTDNAPSCREKRAEALLDAEDIAHIRKFKINDRSGFASTMASATNTVVIVISSQL